MRKGLLFKYLFVFRKSGDTMRVSAIIFFVDSIAPIEYLLDLWRTWPSRAWAGWCWGAWLAFAPADPEIRSDARRCKTHGGLRRRRRADRQTYTTWRKHVISYTWHASLITFNSGLEPLKTKSGMDSVGILSSGVLNNPLKSFRVVMFLISHGRVT